MLQIRHEMHLARSSSELDDAKLPVDLPVLINRIQLGPLPRRAARHHVSLERAQRDERCRVEGAEGGGEGRFQRPAAVIGEFPTFLIVC